MLIFPAIHIGNIELFHILKSMGHAGVLDNVLTLCSSEFFSQYHPEGENYIFDDFQSISKTIYKIVAWGEGRKIWWENVLAIDDEEQFHISSRIATHFALPFYKDITLAIATNKFWMKEQFVKNGVPTGRFALLSNINMEKIRHVGFPNVLKLITGTGSSFLFLNQNESELKRNLSVMKKAAKAVRNDHRFRKVKITREGKEEILSPRTQFLLEEYIGGEEFSCDYLKQGRKIQIIRVVKKIASPYLGYFRAYHLLNPSSIEENGIKLAELSEICSKIADSLLLEQGVCMVDFKLVQGKIWVLETSIRPGISSFIHLMQCLYGHTSLSLLAKLRMGHSISWTIPEEEGAVVYLFAKKSGVVQTIDTSMLEKAKERLGILHIHKYDDVGEIAKDSETDHSGLLRGYVLVKNPRQHGLETLIEEITRSVNIEII